MGIRMIGIDHSVAAIDIRTIFSFTKKRMVEALEQIKEIEGINGCVIISTCNRMEMWISHEEGFEESLYKILCNVRNLHMDQYEKYFTVRSEREAVDHLFHLACGLESRILGEDQIISQVKDALATAREHYVADNVLEILFRMAVTAAKKVKTKVILSGTNHSVIHQALDTLKEEGYTVDGRKCMVIGNGEMGKLAATVLRQSGADVTVTVRQYRSGIVDIPVGCKRIDYGERMNLFPDCDLVVSATASPNYTLTKEAIESVERTHNMILLDLAVPRDIDPQVNSLMHINLYDIDYFKIEVLSDQMKQNIAKANEILGEQMEEFFVWYECRDVIPRIQTIKEKAAYDLELRIQKIIKDLPVDPDTQKTLEGQIEHAAEKVVNKMMFGLRDNMSREAFQECVEGLEKVYQQ